MEMMRAGFARGRISPAGVEARFKSAMSGLDDGLILALDTIQSRARAAIELVGFPDVGEEIDLGQIDGNRPDDVDRQAPRIEVEHEVGEEPVVIRGNIPVVIRRARGDVKSLRVFVGKPNLK